MAAAREKKSMRIIHPDLISKYTASRQVYERANELFMDENVGRIEMTGRIVFAQKSGAVQEKSTRQRQWWRFCIWES